ncbi:hypothetical protein RhiirA1_541707 [Rhizophagus irregularis]|uniref:Uncharacterized protein n=2 Tax=Rhizophagus irregularis TaxID=588596 RepID=A0A2I1F672_9GLOM|nr:hypothetical protein GLOIN_2v1780194 [Rhizophagus irregularis DAOM 181602=DAOM 197198]PKC57240.1 hypothetical protein RhiirA1_541707 [Rhizophagus irregularis]PKY29876.1 hypothetical protein RhiirB3_530751 [Rhizophagus irregularis]POG66785.1 hypothetical protein GLOIN_2v1780194 [Rhizophagus irregularis DAOM 181602=DAOM 197198]GET56047.1 kinase-like domain-containing protein [Rhizophagus irregularis DAOM 181602=DAOM 197198]|eukprot:XP_025173651.1 hypothetical protein GLOIN_2v1780194 [Rhizophagus irregularis DAOM 181602=DAOM 197198]
MVKSNQIYENLQSVKELRKLLMEYNKKFSTPILRGIANIDELIQHLQLNAVHYHKCLEWIPFEEFQNVTYITGKQNKKCQHTTNFLDKKDIGDKHP